MCELTLPTHGIAGAALAARRAPARAGTSPRLEPAAPVPDAVAATEALLDTRQGLWSSRRVRAALLEQNAKPTRR